MPAVLSDTNICDRYVPGAWLPVIEELARFVEIEARLCGAGPDSAAADALLKSHARLLESSAALLEPRALDSFSERKIARLFARAVLLTLRLKQCVVAEWPVIDTARSRMLPLYEADFYGDERLVAQVRQRLAQTGCLDESELAALESEIDRDLDDARQKQSLVRALCVEFGLAAAAEGLPARGHALWRALFPGVPLLSEEVSLIVTATLVFFCLPLVDAAWAGDSRGRSAEDEKSVHDFVNQLARFRQSRFANFPAFGCLDAGRLDGSLLERLAAKSGLTLEAVRRELPRLVTIIPQQEIEKYVVHDVWGHGWQASMLRFEEMYEQLAQYADPMAASESAAVVGHRTGEPIRVGWMDAFRLTLGDVALDVERFRAFASAELAERLTVAMGPVLAEQMADVAEFKLIAERTELGSEFPTSSVLGTFPSKLDLTLNDLPFYFAQATKVFRLWADQPSRQDKTVAQLVERGAGVESARAAVLVAVKIWREMAEHDFAPRLAWKVCDDGRLAVNVFTRLALNFVGLHRSLVEVYRRLGDQRPHTLPLKSYRDLLVIAASVFFESNRAANLWRVDEFVALRFLPLCQALDRA